MTPDSDDLEEALRQNLRLRTELAAEVVKTKAESQPGGSLTAWGWACLAARRIASNIAKLPTLLPNECAKLGCFWVRVAHAHSSFGAEAI